MDTDVRFAEKPRFEVTPVVLLLVFGESFRRIEQSFGKNLHYFDKYHRRWVPVRLAFSFVGYRIC